MFTKFDKWFAETAADPVRRRTAIADYSKRRILFFWLAVVSSVLALAAIIVSIYSASKPGEAGGMAAFVFSPVMMWMIGMKIDSDLRMLKMYDQFYKDKEDSHLT